jgi:hypothetical protein
MTARTASGRPSAWGEIEQLGSRHISTLPRYWITRLYLALSILTNILASRYESQALPIS